MVEEGATHPDGDAAGAGGTQPRVVKKIVKKTVVRPVAPAGTASSARPAAPRTTAVSRLKSKDARPAAAESPADAPHDAPPVAEPTVATETPRTGPRTTFDVGTTLGRLRGRAGDAVHDSGELARRLGFAVRDRGEDAVWAVRDYRVPTIPPLRASLLTGLLAGLLVTGGGWLCLQLFSTVRGTSAGGRLWGTLALLLVVAIAYEVASRLLAAFGVQQARAVLALSVIAVAVVVMLLFLETVDGPWAWLIVPGLMTVAVPLVQRFLVWAATDVPPDDAHR